MIAGDVLDDAGEETAARLRADGLDVTYRHLDVTNPDDWAAAVPERLDVLVNNAGIIHVNPLVEETLEAWNRLLAVNATGTLLGMQAAIPAMRAARRRLDHQRRQRSSASPARRATSPTRPARARSSP